MILLLLALLVASTNASYTIELAPKSELCFDFRTPADRTSIVTGSFEVLDDGADEGYFDFTIFKQGGGKVFKAPSDHLEGAFDLENVDASTRFRLCFGNLYDYEADDDNSFDVGFSIRVSNPPRTLEDGVIGPDTERALKLVEKAAEIHKDWELMRDHQEFTRNREAIHTEMSETILARLSRWAFIEAFLVGGMAVAQIMYWKRFFETKRYL